MANIFTVPLTNVSQRFRIDIAGVEYLIACRWNDNIGWFLDIYNGTTLAPIIMCLPLVTGTDLFAQYPHKAFGASLYVYTDGDRYAVPTLENLGTESNLYVVVM